jgi:16S rRNA processing protein RimM
MVTEITVGVIVRAHGVRGEVVVDLRTDEPERRFAPGEVLHPEQGSGTFTVARTREHQGRWLVSFAEIPDRNAAEAARGVRLVARVPDDERPSGADEYYDRQLIGLAVHTTDSEDPVGRVASVLHLPAHDVLEIATGDDLRLVPFVSELVPVVDLAAGRIVVAPVSGLLDEPDAEDTDEADEAEHSRGEDGR